MVSILFFLLAFFMLFQVAEMLLAWSWYVWRSMHPASVSTTKLPNVAVILSLRGADPSLARCINAAMSQDYEPYTLHIIVDSSCDPAWAVVKAALAEHTPSSQARVSVHLRTELDCYRSLKLNAQRQVLTTLDDSTEVIAFLDADCIPSTAWLRHMITPLADERVGAATGIRWSAPLDRSWGTLARHVFNALAFPKMFLYRIPWGGSLAMRRTVLFQTGLLERWACSLGEDTSTYGVLRASGLRLTFVPGATQVNTETTDLQGAYYFMLRQLVSARVHHIYWPLMMTMTLAAIASFLICCILATAGIAATVLANAQACMLSKFAIIPASYFTATVAALLIADVLVRRYGHAPPYFVSLPRRIVAVAIGIYEASYAMCTAPRTATIEWRGITYDILGKNRIHMRAYRPYPNSDGAATTQSVV
jgi:cellulose synthase/poly-beta-1,6-N-acetylglucosamine synthase-like glycosyltransferase